MTGVLYKRVSGLMGEQAEGKFSLPIGDRQWRFIPVVDRNVHNPQDKLTRPLAAV